MSFGVGSKRDHSGNSSGEKGQGSLLWRVVRSQAEVGGGMKECLGSGSSVGTHPSKRFCCEGEQRGGAGASRGCLIKREVFFMCLLKRSGDTRECLYPEGMIQ